MFSWYLKTKLGWKKKVAGLTLLDGLPLSSHSRARTHYCSTRRLLAAGFPPWPGSPLLSQPGRPKLPQGAHIDAELSADAQSTWVTEHQNSRPQIILDNRPPSSWITGVRRDSQPSVKISDLIFIVTNRYCSIIVLKAIYYYDLPLS